MKTLNDLPEMVADMQLQVQEMCAVVDFRKVNEVDTGYLYPELNALSRHLQDFNAEVKMYLKKLQAMEPNKKAGQ